MDGFGEAFSERWGVGGESKEKEKLSRRTDKVSGGSVLIQAEKYSANCYTEWTTMSEQIKVQLSHSSENVTFSTSPQVRASDNLIILSCLWKLMHV